MHFPQFRGRRVRRTAALRNLVRETTLTPHNFIFPVFVAEGIAQAEAIAAMPGQFRYGLGDLPALAKQLKALDLPGILLFGVPKKKDAVASGATARKSVVAEAIKRMKDTAPDLALMTDVCVCAYTDHGHCGLLDGDEVHNDSTLELLGEMALSHARAGADMVAPSDMMDGRVGYIRETLDEDGFEQTGILSYAAKYASAFYGPFREAAGSAPSHGDRKSYQMDPANAREALLEVGMDVEEGADMIMIKPALAYLDVIRTVRDEYDLPLAAYNVSGEYAMLKAAAERGFIDGDRVMMETLTSIKRAGADIIITYHALDAARLLHG